MNVCIASLTCIRICMYMCVCTHKLVCINSTNRGLEVFKETNCNYTKHRQTFLLVIILQTILCNYLLIYIALRVY